MSKAVTDLLDVYDAEVRRSTLQLRELILDVMPDTTEQVHTGTKVIWYGTSKKLANQVCGIAPHKRWVNLGFFRGTDLPDPCGLLEGTGKRLRHVEIRGAWKRRTRPPCATS